MLRLLDTIFRLNMLIEYTLFTGLIKLPIGPELVHKFEAYREGFLRLYQSGFEHFPNEIRTRFITLTLVRIAVFVWIVF